MAYIYYVAPIYDDRLYPMLVLPLSWKGTDVLMTVLAKAWVYPMICPDWAEYWNLTPWNRAARYVLSQKHVTLTLYRCTSCRWLAHDATSCVLWPQIGRCVDPSGSRRLAPGFRAVPCASLFSLSLITGWLNRYNALNDVIRGAFGNAGVPSATEPRDWTCSDERLPDGKAMIPLSEGRCWGSPWILVSLYNTHDLWLFCNVM